MLRVDRNKPDDVVNPGLYEAPARDDVEDLIDVLEDAHVGDRDPPRQTTGDAPNLKRTKVFF